MGYIRALDIFKFFHPVSLDVISKTLSDKEFVTLNKYVRETLRNFSI